MPLPSEIEEIRSRLAFSTPFWAGGMVKDSRGVWRPPGPSTLFKGLAKIVDERRQLIPLIAKPWQLDLDDKLEGQRRRGEPQRAIIVKARKMGFSTWGMAKLTQAVTMRPYRQAIVVAQDVKTASVLFTMAQIMYAHLPTYEELGLGFDVKPDIVNENDAINGRKAMTFGEKNRRKRQEGRTGMSSLEIDTAKSPAAGRGATPSEVWCSEVAWWEDVNKLVGLLNAVPDEPDTLLVLESTANSMNHFHKRWTLAVEGKEDPEVGTRFVPIFAAWWQDPKYQRLFSTEDQRQRFVDSIGTGPYGEDEPYLVEHCGATPEQLYWRRTTIREKTENNVELFKQEFPANAEEAFIGSGRTVFSGILVARAIKDAEAAPEPVKGTLRAEGFVTKTLRNGTLQVPTGAVWVPESERQAGEPVLEVWEHPVTKESQVLLPEAQRGHEGAYVVAVDVAQGDANTFSEGDFHAAQVFDHRTRMQVAVHESRMDIHLLPAWLYLLVLYYNQAKLAIEVNGPGIAVVEPLAHDYRYPMYRRRRHDLRTEDVPREIVGWMTDRNTKALIEGNFGRALQEGTHGIRHRRTARQLNTYVIDEKGRHGAIDGENDDLLMAAMIGHEVMDELKPPRTERKKKRPSRPVDEITGW